MVFSFSPRLRVLRALALILTLASTYSVYAQIDVQSKTLPNGLTVYVKEDHRAPVLISMVWYKVGSSYESNGSTGISHLLEHMMFKGTPQYGLGVFDNLVTQNGGQSNAFTSTDFTAYFEQLSADKLPLAFDLESDRMRHLNLFQKDFDEEVKVVREERRMRTDNDPMAKLYEQFRSQAFVALPYHNPTVGWPADLDNVKVEDLRQWYQRWYAPNNAIVVVVGDVKADQVFALAEKYFGPLKPSILPAAKAQKELANPGLRQLSLKLPAQIPALLIAYNTPSALTDKNSIDPYALEVLSSILGGSDSARLSQNLVRHQELASSVDTDYDIYARLGTVFLIQAIPQRGVSIDRLKQAVQAQIKLLQDKPVSQAELEKVKRAVIADNVYQQDALDEMAGTIGSLIAVGSDWHEIDHSVTQIQKVSAADVQRVAQQYLVDNQETIGQLIPIASPSNALQTTPTAGDAYVR